MWRSSKYGVVLAAALAFSGVAQAQTISSNRGPAEQPPASFSGNQYVDSDGCVYIRAGVSGNTTWVPRVTRDRKVICGAKPTQTASAARATAPAAAPKPAAAPAPQVTRTVNRAPAAQPRVVQTRRVVQQPQPRVVVNAVPRVRTAPVVNRVPQPVVKQQKAYSYVTPPVQVTRQHVNLGGHCVNRSQSSNAYTNATGVRCGAQGWHPSQEGTVITPVPSNGHRAVVSAPTVTRTVRVQPAPSTGGRTALGQRIPNDQFSAGLQPRPYGYQQTWTDGRLNPSRGLTGQGYVYASPQAHNDNSWVPPRPRVSTRSSVVPQAAAPVRRAVVSSGHKYVQVGSFGVASNAARTANRFKRMGLPVRVTHSRGLQVVMIGPYSSRSSLQSALNSARRAGFGDAFTRR